MNLDPSNWGPWVVLGFAGQAAFGSRFLIQWIWSERKGESVIPMYFWYASITGGLILLTYALHLGDPVFILGQSMGVIVYARNLMLIGRRRRATAAVTPCACDCCGHRP